MAKNKIATAYVQVLPSMEGVAPKVKSVFSGAGDSSGSVFGGNFINKIKGVIVGAGLGKILTDSIMAGSDLQQLKGGVQKIFDEMDTSTIMADAANAYKDLNMSANQYLATINDVGATFASTMGDEKGYSVAKTGLKAISDYASGTGKNVDELSQKFTMITRSTSSYQSIADQFSGILPATSADFLKQAQAAGILNQRYKKLTEVPVAEYQQAVAEMLEKGTAELGLAGNTAAETATTFAGSLAAMKSSYSDFLSALASGEDIGPSLEVLEETVFTFVRGNLMPMVGNILTELPTVLSSAFGMAIRGMNIAADNADAILQQGVDLVISIGSSIITALPYLAEAAWNIVAAIGTAIITTDWIQIGKDTIAELRNSLDLAAAEILGTDGNIVQSVLDAIASGLPDILSSGVDLVIEMANGIFSATPDLLQTAGDLTEQAISWIATTGIPGMLNCGMDLAKKLASGINLNVGEIISSASEVLASLLATIGEHLPDFLKSGLLLIGELIAGIISAIPDVIESIPKVITGICDTFAEWDWGEIGSNIVDGIADGILAGAGAIWTAAKNAAKSALNAAKDFLQIKSPSRKMRDEVGKFIPSGMAVGVKENTAPLTDAMKDLAYQTTSTIQQDLDLEGVLALPNSYGKSSSYKVAGSQLFSDDTLERIIEDVIQSNIAGHEATVAVLREILEAILGIEIDGEIISKAVERYNRKMAVVRGG